VSCMAELRNYGVSPRERRQGERMSACSSVFMYLPGFARYQLARGGGVVARVSAVCSTTDATQKGDTQHYHGKTRHRKAREMSAFLCPLRNGQRTSGLVADFTHDFRLPVRFGSEEHHREVQRTATHHVV